MPLMPFAAQRALCAPSGPLGGLSADQLQSLHDDAQEEYSARRTGDVNLGDKRIRVLSSTMNKAIGAITGFSVYSYFHKLGGADGGLNHGNIPLEAFVNFMIDKAKHACLIVCEYHDLYLVPTQVARLEKWKGWRTSDAFDQSKSTRSRLQFAMAVEVNNKLRIGNGSPRATAGGAPPSGAGAPTSKSKPAPRPGSREKTQEFGTSSSSSRARVTTEDSSVRSGSADERSGGEQSRGQNHPWQEQWPRQREDRWFGVETSR